MVTEAEAAPGPCGQYVGGTPAENLPCARCGIPYADHRAAEVSHTSGDWYVIDGINPEPWEAPTGEARRKKPPAKGFYVQMVSSEQQRAFQQAVRDTMEETYGDVDLAVVDIRLEFYFWRQKGNARNIADATNLQKSLEDALQGVLYKNDRQVKRITSEIVEQEADTEPLILVHVSPALPTDFWVHDLATSLVEDQRAMTGTSRTVDRDRGDAGDDF